MSGDLRTLLSTQYEITDQSCANTDERRIKRRKNKTWINELSNTLNANSSMEGKTSSAEYLGNGISAPAAHLQEISELALHQHNINTQ